MSARDDNGACKVCCGLADKSPPKNTFFLDCGDGNKVETQDEASWWLDGGIKRVGVYHDGFVRNVDNVLAKHSAATVTTYGTRRSRNIGPSVKGDKENKSSVSE